MSNEAMTWVWARTDLKPGPKFVLLALADYADDKGECFPGVAKTAQRCGMDQRTVIRAIAALKETGHIEITHRGGTGSGRKTNVYRMKMYMDELEAKGQIVTLAQGGQSDKLTGGKVTNCPGQSDKLPPNPLVIPKSEPLALAPVEAQSAKKPFDKFWQNYPIKKDKIKAEKAWNKAKLDKMIDIIITDIKTRLEKDDHWARGIGIPYPATYINGERWNDQIKKPEQPGQVVTPKAASHKLFSLGPEVTVSREAGTKGTASLKAALKSKPANHNDKLEGATT